MQQFQAHWRINRRSSPHRDKTGSKIVEAANQDAASKQVGQAVARQLAGCRQDDVCVYMVNKVKK